ncbi:hypothetical protein IWX90DRAFT_440 [Phyllosticta citrichinensis]|uniref:Uncharacterized protein n=1 Tax=Phyllosticta citrichinensis TaxID=1130410 RepID=A0ABR1Y5E4_9PEZI
MATFSPSGLPYSINQPRRQRYGRPWDLRRIRVDALLVTTASSKIEKKYSKHSTMRRPSEGAEESWHGWQQGAADGRRWIPSFQTLVERFAVQCVIAFRSFYSSFPRTFPAPRESNVAIESSTAFPNLQAYTPTAHARNSAALATALMRCANHHPPLALHSAHTPPLPSYASSSSSPLIHNPTSPQPHPKHFLPNASLSPRTSAHLRTSAQLCDPKQRAKQCASVVAEPVFQLRRDQHPTSACMQGIVGEGTGKERKGRERKG